MGIENGLDGTQNGGGERFETHFVVHDAKNLTELVRLRLPQRVPSGFHGTFVPCGPEGTVVA